MKNNSSNKAKDNVNLFMKLPPIEIQRESYVVFHYRIHGSSEAKSPESNDQNIKSETMPNCNLQIIPPFFPNEIPSQQS